MAAVSLRDIVKVYGRDIAVRGIDLDIPDKALVVLVGPSGCGKSTTLRMIAGLESISYGELRVDGRVVNEVPARDRGVAMVFQSYALYPHMNVRQNLEFSLKLAKLPRPEIEKRVSRAVAVLELAPYLERKPAQLSGRAAPARGRWAAPYAGSPRVFLFDEPLSNLDAKLRNQMRAEIKRLQRRLAGHDHLRHPRPGRGDDARRHHRRHVRRHHRADGHAARGLRGAGQTSSWPGSSAPRR